jgi:hypothetical protein
MTAALKHELKTRLEEEWGWYIDPENFSQVNIHIHINTHEDFDHFDYYLEQRDNRSSNVVKENPQLSTTNIKNYALKICADVIIYGTIGYIIFCSW